jgi:DNA-directed RNA polymerase specialized sigma24 family protein
LKIPNDTNLDRYQWESEIERWIFNEQHRKMLKLNLLDGWTYEHIAEEFEMSARQIGRIIPRLQNQLFKHIN